MSRLRFLLDSLLASKSYLVPREGPQELSHQRYLTTVDNFLQQNNTFGILSPVFGLLENDLARDGAGNVEDMDCLQQVTADTAFSNAKAQNSVDGMIASLIYRALERNTPAVGLPSTFCTSITPVNPEIASIQQHQDPASPDARLHNRLVTLELARQISILRGNPLQALDSGTFAAGTVGSSDAIGNSCNEPDCIFSERLLVQDATEQQIMDYVEGCVPTVTVTFVSGAPNETGMTIQGGNTNTATRSSSASSTSSTSESIRGNNVSTDPIPTTTTTSNRGNEGPPAATTTTTAAPGGGVDQGGGGGNGNLQRYNGALLGISAPAVRAAGNGFTVDGAGSFSRIEEALRRSCDTQKNQCADAANRTRQVSVPECDRQNNECMALANS